MTNEQKQLLKAFHEDHQILGQGFHDLSVALRGRDAGKARALAQELDLKAGGHIVFEEKVFYPRLVALLGEDDVKRLYAEHDEGLEVLERLLALRGEEPPALSDEDFARLLDKSRSMEVHIAECGELFAAIGRIPESDQADLLKELLRLRKEAPSWCAYAFDRSRKA